MVNFKEYKQLQLIVRRTIPFDLADGGGPAHSHHIVEGVKVTVRTSGATGADGLGITSFDILGIVSGVNVSQASSWVTSRFRTGLNALTGVTYESIDADTTVVTYDEKVYTEDLITEIPNNMTARGVTVAFSDFRDHREVNQVLIHSRYPHTTKGMQDVTVKMFELVVASSITDSILIQRITVKDKGDKFSIEDITIPIIGKPEMKYTI